MYGQGNLSLTKSSRYRLNRLTRGPEVDSK